MNIQTVQYIKAWFASRAKSDEGATMVEYGLMIALVALVIGVAAYTLGGGVSGLFNKADQVVDTAPTPGSLGGSS